MGWPALEDLEHREPDLAEFVLEELTALHDGLLAAGANSRKTRRLVRRCQALAAVIILALRESHARLWADEPEDEPDDEPGGADGGEDRDGRHGPRDPKGGA